MAMKSGLPVSYFFFILLFFQPVTGRSQQEDSIFYQSALRNTEALYYRQIGAQSGLYNGSIYSAYSYTWKEGSPYFLKEKPSLGSVFYDGLFYDSLQIIYEDLREAVIIENQSLLVQLVNERIKSFVIDGHLFVRLLADNQHPGLTRTGYYEVLYSGKTQLLSKPRNTSVRLLRFTKELSDMLTRRKTFIF